MTNVSKLTGAIKFALFVGTATLATSGLAFAQDDQSGDDQAEATTLDRIEVTGSRLKSCRRSSTSTGSARATTASSCGRASARTCACSSG